MREKRASLVINRSAGKDKEVKEPLSGAVFRRVCAPPMQEPA
jgi:hypothetical protein